MSLGEIASLVALILAVVFIIYKGSQVKEPIEQHEKDW